MANAATIDKINETLDKIPLTVLLVAFLGYLGYDYYSFTTDASSELVSKQMQAKMAQEELVKLDAKIKQANEFLHGLDAKKAELRALAQTLNTTKSTLSESMDVPRFMRMIVEQAKQVGLLVTSIKPTATNPQEFYIEQNYELAFRGVFVQAMVFIDRLVNMPQIFRVGDFTMRPATGSSADYVELEGTVQIKTYQYLGSKADELAKSGAAEKAGEKK